MKKKLVIFSILSLFSLIASIPCFAIEPDKSDHTRVRVNIPGADNARSDDFTWLAVDCAICAATTGGLYLYRKMSSQEEKVSNNEENNQKPISLPEAFAVCMAVTMGIDAAQE